MKNRAPFVVTALLLSSFHTVSWAQSIELNEGLSGAWFNPDTAGQGVLFDIVPAQDLVFMAWFTFEASNAKLGASEARWLTAQGSTSAPRAELVLNTTTGGVFNDPGSVTTEPVGTAVVEFLSCTEARLEFDLPDEALSGEISLVRLAPDVFCASLLATD